MKLSLALGVLAVGLTSFAANAEVLVAGSSLGCFGANCSPTTSATLTPGVTYTGASFSDTTVNNTVSFGSTTNFNNFGTFAVADTTANYSSPFTLRLLFTSPGNGTSVNFISAITGSVVNSFGTFRVDFDNNSPVQLSVPGFGSLSVLVNDLNVNPGSSAPVTGQVTANAVAAVPEPSTWAMMILGFFGVGFMAYRKRRASPGLALRLS